MADLPALHEGSVLLKSQLRCAQRSLRHKLSDHLSPTFSQLLRIGDGDRVVSIALHSAGMRLLSNLLFGINILNSFVLSVITILRLWAVSRSNCSRSHPTRARSNVSHYRCRSVRARYSDRDDDGVYGRRGCALGLRWIPVIRVNLQCFRYDHGFGGSALINGALARNLLTHLAW